MPHHNHPERITNDVKSFISKESISGMILVLAAAIAMVWANSPWEEYYHYIFHELHLRFSFGNFFDLDAGLGHWINDGLMAIFFFTVGLEIKREVMEGELSTLSKAGLPILAAVGGMVVPALIYVLFNYDNPQDIDGWGIPMATDIAFSLGMLSLLGDKVNINLKIFLTALAIADDLGAILVIAIFYTDPASIDLTELINAGVFIILLIIANKMGVRSGTFYGVVGLFGVWIAFLYSGVHATIAGVAIALTVPARSKINEASFVRRVQLYADLFKKNRSSKLLSEEKLKAINVFEKAIHDLHTPLQRLEHSLHGFVAFFVLPLFALANAGVHIDGKIVDALIHPVSLGVMAGLILGKFLGISLVSRAAVGLRIAKLPENVRWPEIYGAAMLAGIGFTMSIFITGLAFDDAANQTHAKVGIIASSIIAAILGILILKYHYARRDDKKSG